VLDRGRGILVDQDPKALATGREIMDPTPNLQQMGPVGFESTLGPGERCLEVRHLGLELTRLVGLVPIRDQEEDEECREEPEGKLPALFSPAAPHLCRSRSVDALRIGADPITALPIDAP
jgi:hypothetical protein